ncbi:MAG: HEAT repeat domain-containing protein [Planctomycetes bacterium]|nr:HEAT repeat domain-containing protein [Planctomycetota bacterium]
MQRLPLLLLCTGVWLAPLRAQDPVPEKGDGGDPPQGQRVEKLEEWPALGRQDVDRLLGSLKQFHKEDEELWDGARKNLVALGEAGMPLLMQKVTDRGDNVNPQIFLVLDEVLAPRHAALMAREIKKPKVELRRYLVRRIARFHDRDMLPVLQAVTKDKDPDIAFHAALGALALGDRAALEPVLEYSKSRWDEIGDEVATVLPAARGREAGNWVFELIAKRPPGDQMAGLRLARYLATKDHHLMLRTYLNANEHSVKKEAINALRVMNGEEPLEKLTVFQVIEMAKEWLKKV